MSLDVTVVAKGLAVGGSFPMEAAAGLVREFGISRIVDLRAECCDDEAVLESHGLLLLKLPTQDGCAVSQPMLDDGVAWVREQLGQGHTVYIHCEYGIGRSALLALCVLCAQGVSCLEALTMLKRARWKVSPSPEQLQAFCDWAGRHGAAVPDRRALERIAYAHLQDGAKLVSP